MIQTNHSQIIRYNYRSLFLERAGMGTFITEDVELLLKLKKGDSERLSRIKNLCQAKKLISISDRKYVERLASQYLEKPESKKTLSKNIPNHTIEQPQIIDEPKSEEIGKFEDIKNEFEEMTKIPESDTPQESPLKSINLGSKKIVFSIASIILAFTVIAIVSYNVDFTSFEGNVNQPTPSVNLIPPYITLVTDEKSYQKADIISVSGETNPVIDGKIRVTVENTQGDVIWAENVQVKDTGEFATLLIGGGQGWEKSGQYTLIAKYDTLETKTSFDFSIN